jgi:hypothetical protein
MKKPETYICGKQELIPISSSGLGTCLFPAAYHIPPGEDDAITAKKFPVKWWRGTDETL